ncbi:sulfotransferase domain-containing protein [Salinibacter ruber]|uniref:Sulfotransferase domain-containing protein n=1 Tax=Salinibacter ruber TaxID=146919 RepID=A0A9X2Z567_9BACT|nr:sulfotransferase domain-containing protein [Salinibacter ruber]MCS3657834.1 hypothetical protein [Salinibacter ruber]MCS3952398.1 hypothetical protein [Salinibacter ruber]MCS4118847.1 hypothetical protein [Salinibacter ruber]MCS4155173.1 hypothetical protein [Salinibacter ruber]MCS4171728.1 hypothetical protein [Salinibacter ruber]
MNYPNFLIAGVPKSGTTTLWKNLCQHPNIFLPSLKEPHFFVTVPDDWARAKPVDTIDVYRSLFEPATSEAAVGEASPGYFSSQEAPTRIRKVLGVPQIIFVFRNPIERAFSHFLFSLQNGLEPGSATFRSAIQNDTVQLANSVRHRPYVNIGYYYDHLQRWTSIFDRKAIKIMFFDDLNDDEVAFTQSVYDFLGVDDSFVPETGVAHAKSGLPKSRRLHSLVNSTGPLRRTLKAWCPEWLLQEIRGALTSARTTVKNWNLKKPALPEKQYRKLADRYQSDIYQLEKETGRDLSHWLSPTS